MATPKRARALNVRISDRVDDALRAWAAGRNLPLAVAADQVLGAALGIYHEGDLHGAGAMLPIPPVPPHELDVVTQVHE